MYVVWRKRPVKGKGGGPFLIEPNTPSGDRTFWKLPLACRHRGEGRVAWTALVVVNERIDGKPRQRVLHRFPTIRSCCIADRLNRAAWWHDVVTTIDGWNDWLDGSPLQLDLSRDRAAILDKLLEVVPRPTPKGRAEFDAYRQQKEREQKERDKADREWWYTKGPGRQQRAQPDPDEDEGRTGEERAGETWRRQARARAEAQQRQEEREEHAERVRRAQEEQARAWRDLEDMLRGLRGGAGTEECFATLGVEPGASRDRVRAAYLKLAKVHHPDKGGDADSFNRIKAAYDRAMTLASKASA